MSEEQNKAPNDGEARVLSDDELKGIVGGGFALGGGCHLELCRRSLQLGDLRVFNRNAEGSLR